MENDNGTAAKCECCNEDNPRVNPDCIIKGRRYSGRYCEVECCEEGDCKQACYPHFAEKLELKNEKMLHRALNPEKACFGRGNCNCDATCEVCL